MGTSSQIDVVRGRMDDSTVAELLEFWAAHAGLTGDEARARLPEVVCVARGEDRRIAGACSAFAADVAAVGGRRFWVYRSLLPGAAAVHGDEMVRATFGALDSEFDGAPGSPIGLCVLAGADERARRPEAVWPDPRMLYAGYTEDGRQLRVGYFDGALVGPGVEHAWDGAPPPGYRVELFLEQDAVSRADVIDLWTRENVLRQAEAERRADEVLFVVTDQERRPVGVCTVYLQRNEQLGMDLWYSRVFVAEAHRRSHIALTLALRLREHLEQRFVAGDDRRAAGVVFEVENEFLNSYYPQHRWLPTDYTFLGVTPSGAHIRIHYFPGVHAPEPAA